MGDLFTPAEAKADQARDLPAFKNLSLPGLRERVAEMLSLIGRVEGIFSTYTRHDISHIDSMLKMLDWLIPPSTSAVMTPPDWLMAVLAIYLHDLGMLVTSQEYDQRQENPEFLKWQQGLQLTSAGRDYLGRTNRMSPEERDRFLFQEFIRMNHPRRIREWITGRHSWTWAQQIKPISDAIGEALKPLPIRFREYLAEACESHHKDNLDRTDLFPLAARCGSELNEIVNVQYAAILLRTTDLMHVTKDRTPSIMYQVVKLSDPKAVEEWDKQLSAFAVGPKGRKLVEGDPDSAVIVVHADFAEERPLFSLQEYVAYANQQIQQSKRWVDKSQQVNDGKDYSFPWHAVKGDVRLEGVPPEPLSFELDRGRLLDLLVGHTIYNDPTVAIRELLQNGIDAVRYQHYLATKGSASRNSPEMGGVKVFWDEANRILSIEDNGIGMDRDVIKYNLMRVGASFYDSEEFKAQHDDFAPISRFGIGILTCFMVSDDIEIVTCKNSQSLRIRMTSVHADYLLRELMSGDPKSLGLEPHGTRVSLRLRDTVDLSNKSIIDILRYWIILPTCSIEYYDSSSPSMRVGYSSIAEAVEKLYGDDSYRKSEVVVKSRQSSSDGEERRSQARYELAFMVETSLVPERALVQKGKSEFPAVCIEGIRVADALPGFEGDRQLAVMLSVTGDRDFRTTVSRSGLEHDEEYQRVGGICAELLFEHAWDEVRRISGKEGEPLSQASTAAEFIVRAIGAASAGQRELLGRLTNDLPSIVFERRTEEGRIVRSLISRNELGKQAEFWVMESRLVDSLGVISRDLGRELSVGEFFSLYALNVAQESYLPLVPDAEFFSDEIRSTHRPRIVEFSRERKQAAVSWIRRTGDEARHDLDLYSVDELLFKELIDNPIRRTKMDFNVGIADIVGDDDRVDSVWTRVGWFIRPTSRPADTWLVLRTMILDLIASRDIARLNTMITLASSFFGAAGDAYGYYAGNSPYSSWRDIVASGREIAKDLNASLSLPDNLEVIFPVGSVFKASNYWRDWRRGEL